MIAETGLATLSAAAEEVLALAPEAVPDALEPDVAAPDVALAVLDPVWPRVGNEALASTVQPLAVVAGQAGRVLELSVYAERGVPVGVRVAHWLLRLLKSGETGVGVPERVNLSLMSAE